MFCVLRTCGFVPPHWHFEGCSLQSLTLHPVGCNLLHLLLPSLSAVSFRVSSGVCVGSLTSWPLVVTCDCFRSFRLATSLRPGPWLIVSFELVPVVRFGSASELCSRLFRALPVARFHPCAVLALSHDFLSPFEVSGFWCPARPCGLPFPPSQF